MQLEFTLVEGASTDPANGITPCAGVISRWLKAVESKVPWESLGPDYIAGALLLGRFEQRSILGGLLGLAPGSVEFD